MFNRGNNRNNNNRRPGPNGGGVPNPRPGVPVPGINARPAPPVVPQHLFQQGQRIQDEWGQVRQQAHPGMPNAVPPGQGFNARPGPGFNPQQQMMAQQQQQQRTRLPQIAMQQQQQQMALQQQQQQQRVHGQMLPQQGRAQQQLAQQHQVQQQLVQQQQQAGGLPILYIASFGGPTPHWGFVHLDRPGGNSGLLIHVGAQKPGRVAAVAGRHEMLLDTRQWNDIKHSSIQEMIPVTGADINRRDVIRVLTAVHAGMDDYQLLSNNCQHFCIAGVKALNVEPQVVANIRNRTSLITKVTLALR